MTEPIQQLANAQLGALGSNATHTLENAAYWDAWHHIAFGGIGVTLLLILFGYCKLWQRSQVAFDSMKAALIFWAVCFSFFLSELASPLYWNIVQERQIGVAHLLVK